MTRHFDLTAEDRRRWRRLSRLALDAAAHGAAVGDLKAATEKARKAAAPDSDAQLATFSPLIRLCAEWPAMTAQARDLNRALLARLARGVEQALGLPAHQPAHGLLPIEAATVSGDLPFRRDIHG